MLIRSYRLTDKLGVALLKSTAAGAAVVTEQVAVWLGVIRRLVGGVAGLIFVALFTVAAFLSALLRQLLRLLVMLVQGLMRLILLIFGVGRHLGGGAVGVGMRLSGRTVRRAGESAAGSASGIMARRAARAELESTLTEDPLRVQNRILNRLVVMTLAALIIVVVWATNPARNPTIEQPSGLANAGVFEATPLSTSLPGAAFSTPVPTATEIPAVLQARGSLAYVVREKGQQDIWLVGIGGERNPIRLTNDPADDRDPAWAPDGRRLAFASRRDGNWDIYVSDLTAGSISRMTFGLEFEAGPEWSPDGQWLVYESYRGQNLDIYAMPVDGSTPPQRLTDHPAPDFSPAWSPDGRQIAFASWRDGNQDIYVFSLDDPSAIINVTNTPNRNEDYPAWSPDGVYLAYSAVDEGLEKVFVKRADDPAGAAQAIGLGRTPTWSPDGTSLVFAVDSEDSTHMVAVPFVGSGVSTEVIAVMSGATAPSWTGVPLPPALVNSGGVELNLPDLYIEQEKPPGSGDPPYALADLVGVRVDAAYLSERVNDSFNALRDATRQKAGVDFLGQLQDAFWSITRPPEPNVERRNWHMTGRQFGLLRSSIQGFPPPMEVIREDLGVNTWWRVYVRVAEDAQDGQLGEPLRRMPWDFLSRNQGGDVEAYEQGGRLRTEVPAGYYIDMTRLAEDYGWQRVPAGSDWRANVNTINFWLFRKPGGLDWYSAMRELYTADQLGGFNPTPTPAPVQS